MKISKKVIPSYNLNSNNEMSPKIKKLKVDKDSYEKPNIPDETVLKALEAVNKLVHDFQKRKNILFADDTSFLLQIEAIKIPRCPKRKLRLKLPHWLVTDTSDICLFVSDLKKGKRVDHEPTVYHYEDLLKEKGITNIKTVMPVRQLRVEYDQLEMKRRLLTQYDFFLADSCISGILAHKLGSTFFNKNALPTPVKMDSPDLKETINKALHKTTIRIHGEGDTFLVKIGIGKQSSKQICENIQSILLQLATHFPGGWRNIRSVHLKTPQSMSIPIYITLRNKNSVLRPRIKPLHVKNEVVEGEVTTVMGAKLRVYPDGTVKVIKRKGGSDGESDDEEEAVPSNKRVKTEKSKEQSSKPSVSNSKENAKNVKHEEQENDDSDYQDAESGSEDEVGEEMEDNEHDEEDSTDESEVASEDQDDSEDD